MTPSTRILVGDARKRLRDLPDGSVHSVITSPPYWRMRTYGQQEGMIGLEATFDAHIENLLAVFAEVWRVLRPEGTLWLNYGDGYANDGKWGGQTGGKQAYHGDQPGRQKVSTGLKPKDLIMMPARIALALQDAGWWLRSEIIWAKTNPLPESVKDRPSSTHEKIYLLSKQKTYFYDADAVRRPFRDQAQGMNAYEIDALPLGNNGGGSGTSAPTDADDGYVDTTGTSLRNIWAMPTAAFPDAHFATFPSALAETCMKAGTSAHGACAACGAPFERVTARNESEPWHHARLVEGNHKRDGHKSFDEREPPVTVGWEASCRCDANRVPCTVLDPFSGAGTVGLVASRQGRSSVLVEIDIKYAELSYDRLYEDSPMFAETTLE